MKKTLAIIFAFVMALSLIACGQEKPAPETPIEQPKGTEAAPYDPSQPLEGYPSGTINFNVGYAAGGSVDVSVRLMTKYLQEYFDKPIIVNNITGASGAVMTEEALKQPADGLTIISVATGTPLADITGSGSFNYLDDFEFVALQDTIPYVISFRADDSRFSSAEECLQYAREHPGELTIGISGVNNACHLTAQSFVSDNGLDISVVPFNGGAEVKSNFLGGHIDLSCDSLSDSKTMLDEGSSKVLCICADVDLGDYLGDAKTASELGLTLRCSSTYRGYLVKKGTDEKIVQRLSYLMGEVCSNEAFIQDYMDSGLGPCVTYMGTEDFTARERQSYNDFLELSRTMGIAAK